MTCKCTVPVQVTVGNQGPYDFMVDSGLTGELITPNLQRRLGISRGRSTVSGLGAGGAVQAGEMVELRGAALYGGRFAQEGARAMLLPPLNAVVTDFPQVRCWCCSMLCNARYAGSSSFCCVEMPLCCKRDARLEVTAHSIDVWVAI